MLISTGTIYLLLIILLGGVSLWAILKVDRYNEKKIFGKIRKRGKKK